MARHATLDASPAPAQHKIRGQSGHAPALPLRVAWTGLRRTWPMLALVGMGMLAAVALLAAVPLYVGLNSDAQMRAALARPPAEVNIEAHVTSAKISADTAAFIDEQVRALAQTYLARIALTSNDYLEAPVLSFDQIDGRDAAQADLTVKGALGRPLGFDFGTTLPHMRLLAGRLPGDATVDGAAEALATPESGLRVGDTVTLRPQVGNPGVVTMRVSGIWSPRDERDPFWNGQTFKPSPVNTFPPPPPIFPLVLTRGGFFAALGTLTPLPGGNAGRRGGPPDLGMNLHYVYFTNVATLRASDIPAITEAVGAFRTRFDTEVVSRTPFVSQLPASGVSTLLDTLLPGVKQQFVLSAQPLYIVVAQLVGLALLYIAAMAGLMVEAAAPETATLTSRGASRGQVVAMFALYGLAPTTLAALAGPALAAALSPLLLSHAIPSATALTSHPADLAADARLAVSPDVLPAVAAGVLLGLAVLLGVAWRSAGSDVLAQRQEAARPARRPFWVRYHLDLGLALLCVAGYLDLSQFGGLGARAQLGQQSGMSLLLLATPGLLLLVGALLWLRLFAPVMALALRVAARRRAAPGVLAFADLARVPRGAVRFSLLLTLAAALCLFALTYRASLARNAADRATYQTGADVRLELENLIEGTTQVARTEAAFAQAPGATAITGVLRERVATVSDQGGLSIPALGIDPATFARTAYWRDDYADQPFSALMSRLASPVRPETSAIANSAIVSADFASALHLAPGDRFHLEVGDPGKTADTAWVVAGIVRDFPTLFASGGPGYVILNRDALAAAVAASDGLPPEFIGPNEYWMRVPAAGEDTLAASLRAQATLNVQRVTSRTALTRQLQSDPLAAGMGALLLAGVPIALLLLLLASALDVVAAARRRMVSFAVLRTLGLGGRELTRVLVTQQVAVYAVGLLAGTLLGLLVAVATLPYLDFTAALTDAGTIDTSGLGIPPFALAFDAQGTLVVYAALALILMAALAIQRVFATRTLRRALRLGED